ncbi:MAG: hypothetical protein IIA88_06455 [Bacteroidetes bacterium]|nr:hypothetical protein [Bacteroidota bacterium]
MPTTIKINPSDVFTKDKYVCEEFQRFAEEYDVYFATASQLNRSSVEEIEYDHSHIAGGISKINTAHNVIGIFTSRSHREKNRIQFQLMKTRSSDGVGSKIDMGFDPDSLRIIDIGVEVDDTITPVSVIQEKLKRKSVTMPGTSSNDQSRSVDGAKIREMLKNVNDDL